MSYELHPLCTLFPRVVGAEFDALVADIKANGLRHPIVLHDGMILDGGNRYRACIEADVSPTFERFDGGNIVSFVLSANLHRRHLSAGQQAAIVASAQDWAKAQTRGGDRKSDQSQAVDFETVEQRAAASGVSRVTQMKADKVAKADPELAKRVAHGEVSLPKAVQQVEGAAPRRERNLPERDESNAAEVSELKSMLAEQSGQFEQTLAENIALQKIVDADDRLAEAMRQIKQLTAENMRLRERINGLTNEAAEAKRLAKSWRSKAERAERAAA